MIEEIYQQFRDDIELYEQENPDEVCERCEEIIKEVEKVLTTDES
jgi:CDP-glycerol glycerophosphotransferase (TagB/SpsB family)